MDEETARLVRQAEQRATALLRDHRPALEHLADLLTTRETIDGAVVQDVLRRWPGRPLKPRARPRTPAALTRPPRTATRRPAPATTARSGPAPAARPIRPGERESR
ncbi:hypothetical protein O1L55_05830 [Streptomyces albulus]|nr:hypothetical protein [Streptomyces noursei]